VDKLRRFEPSRPVWVESESKKIGAIQLPAELLQAMHAGKVFAISAPMSERVKLWREDYSHFEHDLAAMMGASPASAPARRWGGVRSLGAPCGGRTGALSRFSPDPRRGETCKRADKRTAGSLDSFGRLD